MIWGTNTLMLLEKKQVILLIFKTTYLLRPAQPKQNFSCIESHLDLIKFCEIISNVKLFNVVKLVQFVHVDFFFLTSLLKSSSENTHSQFYV